MEPKVVIIGLAVTLIIFGGAIWLPQPSGEVSDRNNLAPPPAPKVENQENQPNSNEKTLKATIQTKKGNIQLELYPDAAPKTVENFVAKAKAGYFNGLKLHRVEDWVIQGGDPFSRDESKKQFWGTGGEDIATELSSKPFIVGAVGVARGPDIKISNDSQLFIVKRDAQFLNNQYTLFGQVVSGMEAVNQIAIGDEIQTITIE